MSPISRLGGRRVVFALGCIYLVAAVGWPFAVPGEVPPGHVEVVGVLVGGSSLVVLGVAYWLPRTEIRPEHFSTVAGWCLAGIGAMLGVLLLVGLLADLDNVVQNVLLLTSLACLAGLGTGYQNATAQTRARNAEERGREADRARRQLERSNRKLERYQTIVETVNDGIYVKDEDGYFTLVNDAYAEMTGYDRENLVGEHASQVVDEETIQMAKGSVEELMAGEETAKLEADLLTADGERVRAEASFATLPDGDGGYEEIGLVRDVTERVERERRLERQNDQLDSFASMLAHELRNPVTIGQIYSEQLPRDTAPEAVEYVADAFDRIEDMIDVMLVVTRGREAVSEGSPVSLADVALAAWDDVGPPDASLSVDIDAEIQADETYVQHLFANLFENAVEHGGDDAAISVGELPTGFYVEDDGCGIPAENRETVFEAGYTTAAGNGGTGLGLAFVRELADVYEWDCRVDESEAGGARFEFTNVATAPRATE
ncbi:MULTISPECIES: PAS domain S-box protein [Halorussus]|uniref:PAS domain S-box protein n=1 Tax=Halorussus TaxID=1070314 RepID=UPI00209E0D6D|nr:PAS domain-containing sensor histidine kinase [Halorussus vallis]USZ77503.1 PAS domain-containing sensor histidine kinase [Halorussus vallis]